jgi:A/G-specific adenine glycosylase
MPSQLGSISSQPAPEERHRRRLSGAGSVSSQPGSEGVAGGALLEWAAAELRDLPWRRTRDPWAVLVSEVMAQQTGVDRVIPYYHAFLEQFPDPAACAAAPAADVLRLWAGLGYNRRGLNLHRCAVALVDHHGGEVPPDLTALLDLPGIGRYTARAILAFAYEQPVGVVDTNVGRVLARWSGRSLAATEAQILADDLVPAGWAWEWNQAVMELGAVVCRSRQPACERCPMSDGCAWFATGLTGSDPADGSAGVSRGQSRFDGSDRQGRGRLVDALRHHPVTVDELPSIMGWPDDPARAASVAATLVADGLAVRQGEVFKLPRH